MTVGPEGRQPGCLPTTPAADARRSRIHFISGGRAEQKRIATGSHLRPPKSPCPVGDGCIAAFGQSFWIAVPAPRKAGEWEAVEDGTEDDRPSSGAASTGLPGV